MDRVVGLEIGADDHLPKRFEPRELLARLQTVLRRARAPAPANPKRPGSDGLRIDLERRHVACADRAVELTGTEFDLLVLLAGAPQRVFNRDEILNRLRGIQADLHTRVVDILISRLRNKLEPLDVIKTLRNAGCTANTWRPTRLLADGQRISFGLASLPREDAPEDRARLIGWATPLAMLVLVALAYARVRALLRPLAGDPRRRDPLRRG